MASLWQPASWPQRLEEQLAATGDLKTAPLRRDVRSLGMLLGTVLRDPSILPSREQCRAYAVESFSWRNVSARVAEVYGEALT